MKIVCSYCRKVLRHDASGGAGLSHGMCEGCSEHFGRLWRGITQSEYLDEMPVPVMVVDASLGRVAAANQKLASALGVPRQHLVGLRGGEAMACKYSRLPKGCGETVHCRDCTIRRSVMQVAESGVAIPRVESYLDTAAGRVPLEITVQPMHGTFVRVTVLDMRPPRPIPAGGRAERVLAAS